MVACLADPRFGSTLTPGADPCLPSSLLRPILAGLEALGGEVDELRVSLGTTTNAAPNARARPERVRGALERCARQLGEPALGIRLAQVLPVGAFGFLEYAAMASPTLRAGLLQAARFVGLVSERMALSIEEADDEARLVLRLRGNASRIPALVDLALAALALRCREAVGSAMALRRVGIAAPRPASPKPYVAHFRAPVVFDAAVDELVFDRALLDAPLRTSDPSTAGALVAHGRGICPDLGTRDPFLDDVRETVRRGLERGQAHVRATAAALRLSVRTLQRRLADLGVSYTGVVDDVRRETALQLVGRRPNAEVAHVLGFTTPAAFFRAFRRWTGKTPRGHLSVLAAQRHVLPGPGLPQLP